MFNVENSGTERRILSEAEQKSARERRWSLVGRVAQESASVEMCLRSLMVKLLNSKYADIIAAGQSATDLIENCIALVQANEEINDQTRERGLELLRSLKPLFAQRNNVVHAPWFASSYEESLTEALSLVSKRRALPRATVVNYAEVEKLCNDLNAKLPEIWSIERAVRRANDSL
ncbi:hypothetical protein [Streptomyces sennicomposti]|uniref:hypothetical protein n=1 Tax=Streptomyces sennicomposti TaxID=2873384 RepID=UPI001CA78ACE|nr:hypothetical protein [Streptomyces sennicomposti]MBY8866672.1 hypothetical protein [Streptomyces sennicomposti]